VRLLEERLRALDRALAEREGCRRRRARWRRKASGSRSRCSRSSRVASGPSPRARAARLGLVADDAPARFALLERARDAGLGSLVVLVGRDPRARGADAGRRERGALPRPVPR
jgi:hypothetical protein